MLPTKILYYLGLIPHSYGTWKDNLYEGTDIGDILSSLENNKQTTDWNEKHLKVVM